MSAREPAVRLSRPPDESAIPPTEVPTARDATSRNALAALGVQLTGAFFTTILTLFLVRKLGPTSYGVFSLAVGFGVIISLASEFGLSNSAARLMAEAGHDRDEVRTILGEAFRLKLAVAVCGALLLIGFAGPIASAYGIPSLAWPLRATAVAIAGQNMLSLFLVTFEVEGRVSTNLRLAFSESIIETASSIVLVLAGAGASGAAFGRAAGFVTAATVGMIVAARALGWNPFARPRHSHSRREMTRYGATLFVVDAAIAVFNRIDVILIGAIIGATAAGTFEAPLRITIFLLYFGSAMASAVAPRLSRTVAQATPVDTFVLALRYLVIIQVAFIVPMIVWATPLTNLLLGSGYSDSAAIMRALTPWVFLAGLAGLLSVAVNYVGRAASRIPAAVAAVIANIAFDLIFIPKIGAIAGAYGSAIGYLIYTPGHFWILRAELGFELRPLVFTVLRALLAGAAMVIPMVVIGTTGVGWAALIGGLAAASVLYVAGLVVVGEVTPADIKFVASRLLSAVGL